MARITSKSLILSRTFHLPSLCFLRLPSVRCESESIFSSRTDILALYQLHIHRTAAFTALLSPLRNAAMRSPSNHLAVLLLLLLGSLPPLLSLIFSFPLPPGNVSLASAIFPPAVIFPRNSATHGERLPFNGRGEIVPEPRPPHLDPAIPSDLNTKNKTNPNPRRFTGAEWWGMGVLAIVLIILTGLLAGLTLGVMSVDLTRLRVWSNTGSEDRR